MNRSGYSYRLNTIAREASDSGRGQAGKSAMDGGSCDDAAGCIDVAESVGGAHVKQMNVGDGVDELSTNAGEPHSDCVVWDTARKYHCDVLCVSHANDMSCDKITDCEALFGSFNVLPYDILVWYHAKLILFQKRQLS